nr:MAG: ORF1 [TTV-like mini virus]
MPYYQRRRFYRNYRWKPRYRRNWIRRIIRRKFRRRRHRRVRINRKPLPLLQWQPPFIKNCKIKGRACLVLFNPKRLAFNSVMYEESIVPDHWPGGGGFSVTRYTLNALYDLHLKCRNWWTNSNTDLPLCRYKGCSIKFYKCEFTDYVVKIQTQLPSNSNKLTYPSCQPSMMLMSDTKIIIPSKRNQPNKKPYRKIFIPPPPQLQNKWYFQVDLYNTSLLTLHTAACSLENYFQKPDRDSYCITFTVLNTMLIQNRDMGIEREQSWPYKKLGTYNYYFYASVTDPPVTDTKKQPLKDLVALVNPRNYTSGLAFSEQRQETNIKTYFQNWKKYWGNPFHNESVKHYTYYTSLRSPEYIIGKAQQIDQNSTWETIKEDNNELVLTEVDEPIFYKLQYNPFRDTGIDTKFYLLSNKGGDGWLPSSNDKILLEGFPMWIGLYGYLDFQNKLKEVTNIDTNQILVIQSNFTQKPHPLPIVILNESWTQGCSPYETYALDADKTKWYPQVQYQTMELNKIVECGPGTPYLPKTVSENITMFYKFYWQWGGSPPKTVTVENPSHQITYPIPSNEHDTTSLQSPAQAPESTLYSFDFRHGQITTTALERITKDWRSESFVNSITDADRRRQLQKAFLELQQTETEEQEKEAQILQQLSLLKQQQQRLRQHIISIMQTQSA